MIRYASQVGEGLLAACCSYGVIFIISPHALGGTETVLEVCSAEFLIPTAPA